MTWSVRHNDIGISIYKFVSSITPPCALDSPSHRIVHVAFQKFYALPEHTLRIAAKNSHFPNVNFVLVLSGSERQFLFFGVGERIGAANQRDQRILVVFEVVGFVELLQGFLELGSKAHFGVGVGVELRLGDFLVALGILGLEFAGGRRLFLIVHQLHGLYLPHHLFEF